MFKLVKRFISGVMLSVLIVGIYSSSAFAWGLTIEDIMERYGISRTDRTNDLRKLILDGLDLEVILPWENYSPDLSGIIDATGVGTIYNAYQNLEKSYETIESTYTSAGKSLSSLTSGLERLDSYTDKYLSSITSATKLDFDSYLETDASVGGTSIDINKMLKEEAESTWSSSGQETMKNMNSALQPFASTKAALGATKVDNAHIDAYPKIAAAHYANAAAAEIIEELITEMAKADVLAMKIKKQGHLLTETYLDAFADKQSSFTGSGGAWRATASAYAVMNKLRLGKDLMGANLYKMFTIRFKVKTYLALLETYNYVNYCHEALQGMAERRTSLR